MAGKGKGTAYEVTVGDEVVASVARKEYAIKRAQALIAEGKAAQVRAAASGKVVFSGDVEAQGQSAQEQANAQEAEAQPTEGKRAPRTASTVSKDGEATCGACGTLKPATSFPTSKGKDGEVKRSFSECRACRDARRGNGERKAKAPRSTTRKAPKDRLEVVQGLKEAGRLVRDLDLRDEHGQPLQPTRENYEAILAEHRQEAGRRVVEVAASA